MIRVRSRAALGLGLAAILVTAAPVFPQEGAPDLPTLSLDSLLNIRISSASKYEQLSDEAPASVTIITAEDIERFGYRTIYEALTSVPGFYGSYDRNYAYVGARGLSRPTDYNNRFLLMLDGHSWNENFYDSAFLGTAFGLNLDFVERIEVVRGPGSALYGSNAMFAVVNVVSKSSASLAGLQVTGEAGSFGVRGGAATFGRQFTNGLDIVATASVSDAEGQDLYFAEFDDPLTNSGVADGLDWDRSYGLRAIASYKAFSLAVHASSRDKGIPTGSWEMLFNDDAARTRDARMYAELKFEHDFDATKNLSIRGSYDSYSYAGGYPYEEPYGLWVDSTDGRWLGGEARFRWDPVPANRLQFGAELRHHYRSDYRSYDLLDSYLVDDFPFTVSSAYAQNDLQLTSNLAFTAGVRVDHYSDVGTAITPRGAIVYHPFETSTAKLLYGEAYRAPNRWEFYYEEPSEFKRNPDLKPETIRTFEFVWEQRVIDGLFGSVSLYNYTVNDLINETVDPEDDLSVYQNFNHVHSSGVELEMTGRFPSGFGGFANYTYQHARDHDGAPLTNSPRHLMRAGLFYPVIPWVTAAVNVSFDDERLTVQDTKTDSYFLTHLTLSTTELVGRLRASFSIRNLFDSTYMTPGGFEHTMPAIEQDGRHLRLILRASF